MNWINFFNLISIVLILIPNILFARRISTVQTKYNNKPVLFLEQIGRYGSMFFMVVPVGLNKMGFRSNEQFVVWLLATVVLLLLYWIFWRIYLQDFKLYTAMALAIVPSILFLLSGILQGNWMVVITGIIFGISHCLITFQNNRS